MYYLIDIIYRRYGAGAIDRTFSSTVSYGLERGDPKIMASVHDG
jgi:hypothetical protein